MYTHVIADLSKEFHCARCGIIQPVKEMRHHILDTSGQEINWDNLMWETMDLRDYPLCEACARDLMLSSPLPPSEPSQQT